MNRKEFLSKLNHSLEGLSEEEIVEILYDYEEHFNVGLERGKTEYEIAKELGDPKSIAKAYKASIVIENAQKNPTPRNIAKAVIAIMILGSFNLFILGPFIGIIGMLIGLYGAALGVTIGGIGVTISTVLPNIIDGATININPIAKIFIGIGLSSFGLLFFILDFYISKILYKGTLKYLKWNMDFITKQNKC